MNPQVLAPIAGHPRPGPPEHSRPPRGFVDCRGEWQDLDDDDKDHDAAP
ncbi:hypothetical protein [Aeromicrobium sp. Root236]|nr:hypothetical protein [Aeromicrobium sp. Root236]